MCGPRTWNDPSASRYVFVLAAALDRILCVLPTDVFLDERNMILYRCKRSKNGQQCDTRNALPRAIEKYKRKPRCKGCRRPLTGYVDRWQRRANRSNTCNCNGLPYPHRGGSSVWCMQHPTGPAERDYQDRYGHHH